MLVGKVSSMTPFNAQDTKTGNNTRPKLLHPTNLREDGTREE
jgi:hypothetical protein